MPLPASYLQNFVAQIMKPIEYFPGPSAFPLSKAIRAGDFVYLSGQIPLRDGKPLLASIEEQTHAVLTAIAESLLSAGSSIEQVIKTTVWLSDLGNFERFNQVYKEYFKEGAYPVRSTVEAKLAFGVAVEIEAQAYSPVQ